MASFWKGQSPALAAPDGSGRLRYGLEILLTAFAYFALAKAGLALASIHPSASPIWPPTGFAFAILLLRGLRLAPAIFLGALAANATTDGSLATAAAIAAGNTLEGAAGTWLIGRWSGGVATFDTTIGVVRFSLVSIAATTISATLGVGSLALAGHAEWTRFADIWFTWWMGDFFGALLLAPVIVLWARQGIPRGAEFKASAAVYAGAVGVGLLAFSPLVAQTANRSALAFLAIAPLMWAALRRNQRDTATVALLLSGFAVWGTAANGGPFGRASLNESFLLLLMFMISAAVPSLALAADAALRRRTERDLERARAELEQTVHLRTLALGQTTLALENEAQQRRQEQAAETRKMEALGQLTSALAHDFNNVLMIVSGHAQMLQRRLQDARLAPPLASIRTAVAQGENLTRRLLAFSRRQMLSPTVVNLAERIAAARETLTGSLTERIALEYDVAPELWPVAIDAAELDLALKNIAANAHDAMPDGGTLTLSARNVRLDADAPGGVAGEFVALSLSDTGGGIAPDVLPKVFEPFFTTKPAGMGAGLGLSQVYGFAHRSGGRVTAESRSGEGTTITVYLPRSHTSPSAAIVSSALTTSAAPGTVLVVEDNPQVADVTSELLEHLGYRTVRAENAVAALQTLARNHEIGLVFTDITMPGMNGIALAHEIVKRHPAMPVLLTTGYSEALQAGQGEFPVLRKPFEIPALERAVRRAMHRAQSGNDARPSA